MSQGRSLPKCSGDASMPDNEPGASTRVIEKLNLRKGRLRWTMFVASERERERVCENERMRERERERENVYDCERTKEVRRTRRETKRERERDCKAVKVCILNN